jgi:hypothetical protein
MSIRFCAFIEYHLDGCWHLFDATELAHREPRFNFAPQPWGEYNFSVYYQQSGEKNLPTDLSDGLKQIITTQLAEYHGDGLNRPSWMSLEELLEFFASDVDCRYAHFDLDYLKVLKESMGGDIRLVFWAE